MFKTPLSNQNSESKHCQLCYQNEKTLIQNLIKDTSRIMYETGIDICVASNIIASKNKELEYLKTTIDVLLLAFIASLGYRAFM